ncbi:MAG: HK97 gp10 family phage protein [Planctomycetota bacterium]
MAKITLTGERALDRELLLIAGEDGTKSINGMMRKATREAAKEIVLPEAKARVAHDEGNLEDNLTVRAVRRSRVKVGHRVGFRDPLFQGDTFYGGFIEFGFTHYRAGDIERDSYLRYALYGNEEQIKAVPRQRLGEFVRLRNRKV